MAVKRISIIFLLAACQWITSFSFHLAVRLQSFSQASTPNEKQYQTKNRSKAGFCLRNFPIENPIDDTTNIEKWKSRAILLTVAAFYGTNYGCVKILDDALPPSTASAMRFSLSALVFLPYLIKTKQYQNVVFRGLEVGAYAAIGYWGQTQALLTSNASTVSFICSLSVIFVPILNYFKKSRTDSSKNWFEPLLPAFIALAGVGCLELGGSTPLPGVGDLWALSQPIFFGLSIWRAEYHIQNMKGGPGELQTFTAASLLAVAAFCWVWASSDFGLFHTQVDIVQAVSNFQSQLVFLSDWHVIAAIFWTGIVTTALTIYGENVALKNLSAVESTIIYTTEPLWGTAFAAAALGETLGWDTALGACLIVTACLWSSLDLGSYFFPGLKSASLSTLELKTAETQNLSSGDNEEASNKS